MKSIIKVSILSALLIGLTVDVSAQQRNKNNQNRPKGDCQGQMMNRANNQGQNQGRMMGMLDLTDAQQEQIEEIRLNGQKGMIPLRNNIQEKNAQLRTLRMATEYDETAVNALIEEIGELRTAMMTMRSAHQQQVREVLNEEQRVQFDTFQQRKGNNRQGPGMNRKNQRSFR